MCASMFGATGATAPLVRVLHQDQARPLGMTLPDAHQAIRAFHRALAGEVKIRALPGDAALVAILAVEADVRGAAAERAEQLARVPGLRPDVVDLRQEALIVPIEPLRIRHGHVDGRRRQVLQPYVLEHEVDVRTGGPSLRVRAAPREPCARRELRERRTATLRLPVIDERNVYSMAASPQCVRKQIDVARQADAVRLADDVDVEGSAAHRSAGLYSAAPHSSRSTGCVRVSRAATCPARRSACRLAAPAAHVAPGAPECRRAFGHAPAPAPRAAGRRRTPPAADDPRLRSTACRHCRRRPLRARAPPTCCDSSARTAQYSARITSGD